MTAVLLIFDVLVSLGALLVVLAGLAVVVALVADIWRDR